VFSVLNLYANEQKRMSDLSKIKMIHVKQKHKAQMYYKDKPCSLDGFWMAAFG
jgi:hypothetical protein